MRFSKDACKIFNHLRKPANTASFEGPNSKTNNAQGALAFTLGIGIRRVKRAIKLLQAYGFLEENLSVPEKIRASGIAKIQIENGSKLLRQKEERRRIYLEKHGSMTLQPSRCGLPSIRIELNHRNIDWD